MLFQCLFTLFFTFTLLCGFFNIFASERAVLSVKARMKVTRNVSVSCKDILVKNPFALEMKGMTLENAISIKVSYNGYRKIQVMLKQKKNTDSSASEFAFYHENEKKNKTIMCSFFFNKSKLPLVDGLVLSMDSNTMNPIIDEIIGLDLHINPFKNEKSLAGNYTISLQLVIMEIE